MKRATCTGPPSGEPVQVVFISRRRPAGAGLVGGVGNWPAKNWPARTWCTKPRKTLFLRFLCTKSQVIFGAGPAKTWCTNSRKPLFLRLLCTKSQIRFASQPAKLAPGSSQSHIPPSGHANTGAVYSARGRLSWRLAPREAIFHRQATPTPAPFSRRVAGHVGAWLPAKPLSSVRPRQHRRRLPDAWPTKLAPGSPQSHIPPSGHANTGAVFPARGRPCWRLAPRKAFVFRQATPTPAPFSRRVAVQVGAWFSAKPYSTVRPRQHGPDIPAWRHHCWHRPAVGTLDPEDVVLGDERIRDCGEGRTTSS